MNIQSNDIINSIFSNLNRLDLIMISKCNKRFNEYSRDYLKINKNYEICKFPIVNRLGKYTLCTNAAFEGYLDVLKWLRLDNYKWYSWKYISRWKKPKIFDWNSDTCAYAALNGHLETLKWARTNDGGDRCDWDWMTCACAAQNGHLETLKWARANGCVWNS